MVSKYDGGWVSWEAEVIFRFAHEPVAVAVLRGSPGGAADCRSRPHHLKFCACFVRSLLLRNPPVRPVACSRDRLLHAIGRMRRAFRASKESKAISSDQFIPLQTSSMDVLSFRTHDRKRIANGAFSRRTSAPLENSAATGRGKKASTFSRWEKQPCQCNFRISTVPT